MLRFATATAVFAAAALGQIVVMPSAAAATDGNTSSGWPFDVANQHIQYIYDSSHFTSAGITFPVLLNRLRLRANGATATWAGSTSTLALKLSTAPFDHTLITNTFTTNLGPDQATVYSGPLVIPGGSATTGSPGPYHVDVLFSSPFLYDPTAGDLTIDYLSQGVTIANTPTCDGVSTAGVALASRMQTTTVANLTGTIWSGEFANVIEFTYTPASGLFASFTADVTSGPSPLTVNFSDASFSSDPGGITSWAWDFNGDSIVDSALQNPQFTYNTCGNFNVTLTVTDAAHPPSSITNTGLISTDDITASFTTALLVPPNIYQLTDTSTPPATSWAWDTDGDTVADNFTPNPVVVLPQCDGVAISLTATRNCKSDSASQTLFVSPASLATLFAANNGGSSGWITMSDYNVTHPCGISICAIDHNTGTTAVGTPFTFDVYLTENTWVGKDNNIAFWRLAGSGSGTAQGNNVASTGVMTTPLHLPRGSYGVAIQINGASVRYTGTGTGGTPVVYSNADLSIATGSVRSTLFSGGSFFQIREWNGRVHYSTCTLDSEADYGWFGGGCAGTMPAGGQTINSPPVMGSNLSLTFDNLPFSVTVAMLGFSNTFATGFGPLPIDLTGLGMTGCTARISPDMTFFIVGGANSATLNVFIPTDPVFLCVPIYTQALTPDPAGNAFGWVLSAAAGGPIGN